MPWEREEDGDVVTVLREELAHAHAEIARLSALAYEDDLTRALNRRGYAREVARLVAHCARYGGSFALILADLDGLKRINDHLGHPAGDELISDTALILRQNIRASDALARIGGDEFAILLWQASEEQVRVKAEDLKRRVEAWQHAAVAIPDDVRSGIGLSAGVAVWRSGDTEEAIYARADADLYFTKARRGRIAR